MLFRSSLIVFVVILGYLYVTGWTNTYLFASDSNGIKLMEDVQEDKRVAIHHLTCFLPSFFIVA